MVNWAFSGLELLRPSNANVRTSEEPHSLLAVYRVIYLANWFMFLFWHA